MDDSSHKGALPADPGPAWQQAAAAWPLALAAGGHLLAVKDARSGRYLALGPALGALLGVDEAAALGRTDAEIFGPVLAAAWRAADQAALDRGQPLVSDHAFEWQGQRREFCVTRLAWQPPDAGVPLLLSHWVDVREPRLQAERLREALAQLERERQTVDALRRQAAAGSALTDAVSGLPGPVTFQEQLRREFDLSARESREMSLILLQVDSASSPDLPMEHAALEDAAREMGTWLRSSTRAMDATARLDAGRYAILVSGAGLAIASRRAEALRAARPAPAPLQPGEHGRQPYAVSMGVASYPLSAESPDLLLAAAQAALERARQRGGNQVSLAPIPLAPAPQ